MKLSSDWMARMKEGGKKCNILRATPNKECRATFIPRADFLEERDRTGFSRRLSSFKISADEDGGQRWGRK